MRIRIPRFLGAKLYPKYMNCKRRFKGIKEGMFWYEMPPYILLGVW